MKQNKTKNFGEGVFIKILHKTTVQKAIYSNSDFFSGDIIINFDNESMYITKPNVDYKGKTRKPARDKSGTYNTSVMDYDYIIPLGRFMFNEEDSTEDCLILDFN